MNEATAYYLTAIRNWVWSGFYSAQEVSEELAESLDGDEDEGADEALLQATVGLEFANKQAAETAWPAITDCDRLDQAFNTLNACGIIALHNAGYTQSDGWDDVREAHAAWRGKQASGYCFYHFQDLERAIEGEGLWLAFGSLGHKSLSSNSIGQAVRTTLQTSGLEVDWDKNPKSRLHLPRFDWKRRSKK